MRRTLFALAAAALAAGSAHAAPRTPGEQLAREIEGRLAGEPVSCIPLRNIRSTRIIDGTAIVYHGPGNVVYVNRPDAGARSLDHWDLLVTDTIGDRLCNVDVVRLYDRGARVQTGLVFLGDFIPYRYPKSEER